MAAAFSTSLRNAMSRVFFFKFINKNIRKRESISKIRRYENLNLSSNQTWGYLLLDKMKKKTLKLYTCALNVNQVHPDRSA